jgi:hypothetical protein
MTNKTVDLTWRGKPAEVFILDYDVACELFQKL